MKDRFDLENEINRVHNYIDDIRMIIEFMLNDSIESNLDIDKYANALEGIASLMEIHNLKMFDTMCQCFRIDNYKE
jgi:hypothetical protein